MLGQSLVQFLRMREGCLARTAPCAPHVDEHNLALEWLKQFFQYLLALGHAGYIVAGLHNELVQLAVGEGNIQLFYICGKITINLLSLQIYCLTII